MGQLDREPIFLGEDWLCMLVRRLVPYFAFDNGGREMSAGNEPVTLRLIMPEWQGGDYDLSVSSGELYPLGARLLDFLAPKGAAETVAVPIEPYRSGLVRKKENGVVNQDVVIRQMQAVWKILDDRRPDKVVTFGGECLVSQAPFDYLNGRYNGNVGILWIDSHPDVSTPANHDLEHAMVLGNLLGGGDPVMAKEVRHPFDPRKVLLVGQDKFDSPNELEAIKSFGLSVIKPHEAAEDSGAVVAWLKENKIGNLAIHFDLDALNPANFHSQLTNDPFATEKYPTVTGKLDLLQMGRLLKDVSENVNVVGLTFAEFMPWDALYLQKMMNQLPIMHQ